MNVRLRMVVALAAVVLSQAAALRAAPPDLTVITIPDLECKGCVKRVEAQLLAVPGVAKVQCDIKARTAWVTPKAGPAPSPRAIWEAVEQAGKEVSRIQGPSGTFTAKP